MAAAAGNDIWAVGNGDTLSFAEHWNGKVWSLVTTAHTGTGDHLNSVAVASASDAWAVGWSGDNNGVRPLIEHWNGTAWSVVPSPAPGSTSPFSDVILNSVAVASATDAWAVGSDFNDRTVLIEHWDGTAWSQVAAPNPSTHDNELNGIAIVSATDAWAVGSAAFAAGDGFCNRALTEHWNGSQWTEVATPKVDAISCVVLHGVAASASGDVWAVGTAALQALTEHFDGSKWRVVPSATTGTTVLYGVTSLGTGDAWAVGDGSAASSGSTFTEQWNGGSWKAVPSPTGTGGGFLRAVTALPDSTLWTVGDQRQPGFGGTTLVLNNAAG
ncbi:MAG: hypothetical protein J2P15_05695 [Micromonosporaceae bacterium]|nr:hypothetical protein [Micromonosporaceae bacterium]